jgi:hypothetical protein
MDATPFACIDTFVKAATVPSLTKQWLISHRLAKSNESKSIYQLYTMFQKSSTQIHKSFPAPCIDLLISFAPNISFATLRISRQNVSAY